jgi:hypothetical protein
MFNFLRLLIIFLIFSLCIGCARPFRFDGPYEGRIIDAESNQPIEGVVVDAVWEKVYPNVAGSSSEYFDTKETVTDKNGEFSIPGHGVLVFSAIDYPNITMFKAGYDGDGNCPWVAYDDENIRQFKGKVTRQKGKLVFRLKKLGLDERKKRIVPFPSGAPNNRIILHMIESNKEMMELGKQSDTLYDVDRYR